jgi:hypothetical protein
LHKAIGHWHIGENSGKVVSVIMITHHWVDWNRRLRKRVAQPRIALNITAIDHVTSGNNQIGFIDPLGQTEDRLIKPMTIGFIDPVWFEAEMQICNLRN